MMTLNLLLIQLFMNIHSLHIYSSNETWTLLFCYFIKDTTLRLDDKFLTFKQTPCIHSTGYPSPTNHDWWNMTMEKQHKAPFASASYNSQQEHVINNRVPVENASFPNDLSNVFNLCKCQHTRPTDNVHDILLPPMSNDINSTNREIKQF